MVKEKIIEYDLDDLKAITPVPSLNLPDIEAVSCLRPIDGSPYMIFQCETKLPNPVGCPECGSIDVRQNGYLPKSRVVHDINIGITRVDLIFRTPRLRCKDCSANSAYIHECLVPGRQMTKRLLEQIRRDCFPRSFSDVAREFGYTEATIRNIFDDYAEELESQRGPIIAPRVLGIDEKFIEGEMRGVFINNETGALLEMTAHNKREDVIQTIEGMVDYDKNIQVVTTDMANNYRSYIQECLPNAVQIIDKYHVFQDLTRKVTKARTAIVAEIGAQIAAETDPEKADHMRKVRELVIHNAYLFKFGKKKLTATPRRMSIMADVCKTFPEFNHLRLLKEGFERIYEKSTAEEAETAYNEWSQLVPPTGARKIAAWEEKYGVKALLYIEFKPFYNTTKKWHEEFLNYFRYDCKLTNATAEGLNSTIQSIRELGRGYGYNRLRAKMLYRYDVRPKIKYSIKTKEIPTPSSGTHTSSDIGNIGFVTFDHDTTKTVAYIDAEVSPDQKEQEGLLNAIDEQSDFYEFYDSEEE